MTDPKSEIETGISEPSSPDPANDTSTALTARIEVIFVGDPMCSWCWGASSAVQNLRDYCKQRKLQFRVVVGGLRPGGGDLWNHQFRETLRNHWQKVSALTGQKFNYEILDWDSFEYDTEPGCRSVVVARSMLNGTDLDFFSAVQQKFYVENEDPTVSEFYESICADIGLDFDTFVQRFESSDIKAKTYDDFELSRNWGVSGFPSILLQKGELRTTIASGFSTFETIKGQLDNLLSHIA